jgi:hypothetical protein
MYPPTKNQHGLQISDSGNEQQQHISNNFHVQKNLCRDNHKLGRYFKFQQPQVSTTEGADANCIKDHDCNVRWSKLSGKMKNCWFPQKDKKKKLLKTLFDSMVTGKAKKKKKKKTHQEGVTNGISNIYMGKCF